MPEPGADEIDIEQLHAAFARRIARARPSWMRDAACAGGRRTALFFPERGVSAKHAIAICATCPALTPCRDWAIADPTLDGVAGGMTARARQRARTERATRRERQAAIYR